MIHIIHKIPHATDALLRAYAEQAAATVHEAMGQRGAMTPDIKPNEVLRPSFDCPVPCW